MLSSVPELNRRNVRSVFDLEEGSVTWAMIGAAIGNGELNPDRPDRRDPRRFSGGGANSDITRCEFLYNSNCDFVLADSAIKAIDEILVDSEGRTAEVHFTMHWIPRTNVVEILSKDHPRDVEFSELEESWRRVAYFRYFDQGGWRLREID